MMSSIWDQVINMASRPTESDAANPWSDASGNSPPSTPQERLQTSRAHTFRKAERANKVGKICLLIVNVLFNVCFWGIAINEYLRPAEQYITAANAEEAV